MSTKPTVALLIGATMTLMALPVVGALRAHGRASAPAAAEAQQHCEGYVGVTFDDGPTHLTPALLEILAEHDVRATMFNLGVNALRPPRAREGRAAGRPRGRQPHPEPRGPDHAHPRRGGRGDHRCERRPPSGRRRTGVVPATLRQHG